MKMVNLKINDLPVTVPEGTTILEAARKLAIDIPTLCYLKDINEIGACRICVVEVKGLRNLVASCVYPVTEGMEVYTNSKRVFASRKIDLELILSTHKKKCLSCVRSGNCELQKTQGGDINGQLPGSLQDGGALRDGDRKAVNL